MFYTPQHSVDQLVVIAMTGSLLVSLWQIEMKKVEVNKDYDNSTIDVEKLKEIVLMSNVICRTI
jgi:hypothetical protein